MFTNIWNILLKTLIDCQQNFQVFKNVSFYRFFWLLFYLPVGDLYIFVDTKDDMILWTDDVLTPRTS